MHAAFYPKRDDIHAVVRTHSSFAKTLASLRWDLPVASYLVTYTGENVCCTEYASFGTKELADNALEAMKDRRAVFFMNTSLKIQYL